jgi:hypothetical protein
MNDEPLTDVVFQVLAKAISDSTHEEAMADAEARLRAFGIEPTTEMLALVKVGVYAGTTAAFKRANELRDVME